MLASRFIGVAERIGVIAHIDRQMIARAVAVLDRRHRSGKQTQLFVNQSPAPELDANRMNWLDQLLKLRDIEPEFLVLEFRLTDLLDNSDACIYVIELRQLGVGLCLSGVDGSPGQMELIEQLDPNYVKLMQLNSISAQVDLKEAVKRLHELELRVIMPTVEDARTAASLWSYEVDFIQGNFVQAPEPTLAYQFATGE